MVGYKYSSNLAKKSAEVAQKRAVTRSLWVLSIIEVR